MRQNIEKYLEQIHKDYITWLDKTLLTLDEKEIKIKYFKENLRYTESPKYFKILNGRNVHSFIVKVADTQFKSGDILRAAGFTTPAKTYARGNVFDKDSYGNTKWTGA